MSSRRSPDEITQQMWGRFDRGNDVEERRHQTTPEARTKEIAEEGEHRTKGDPGAYTPSATGDMGDMGENDSPGG